MKFLILFLMIIINFDLLFANDIPPVAKAMIVKGEVYLDGKQVVQNQMIDKPGVIKTGAKGFIKLAVEKWNNQIIISSNSEMILNFSDEKKYTLQNGSCRWITNLKQKLKNGIEKPKGKIYTSIASLGVRGTDFILIANPLFGETEVAMFDGSVEFQNLKDENDKVTLNKGQWGGIGGRYGQKLQHVITLNQEQLQYLDQLIKE